jgi:hypothetical protein
VRSNLTIGMWLEKLLLTLGLMTYHENLAFCKLVTDGRRASI